MEDQLHKIRHSLAHLLASVVKERYPQAKLGIGPVIDNGLYYDFDFSDCTVIPTQDDFKEIEKGIRRLVNQKQAFVRDEVEADRASEMFATEPYKLELIKELKAEGQKISTYTNGAFTDLCAGPHVANTSEIKGDAFKLERLAGAYWKGSEKNAMLTRIYVLAFNTKEELDAFQAIRLEAEKRDHKKLGPQLDLFVFSDLVGAGLPLWTPKGTLLRNLLDNYVWQLREEKGYERVEIPHITRKELYEKSGHWAKYQDDLFKVKTREGHDFAMKPMNCPHHTQIYARQLWSYREMPQRYANTTMCYRDEQTGELAGISRTRAFTQDDAHVFCRMNQVKSELKAIWDIVHRFYGTFDMKLKLRLSLRDPKNPDKYLGNTNLWDEAETILREISAEEKTEYSEGLGEAAFYGPKLDFMAVDSIGRTWQVATIQLDMVMPERFDLYCVNEDGTHERVVMIHAAIMGSIERFLSVLIEHVAGAFPLWMSPVQAKILPISENQAEYGAKILAELKAAGIRAELDGANDSLGKRIRKAKMQKVPYIIVVGEKEVEEKSVTAESRDGSSKKLSVGEFIEQVKQEEKAKKFS